MISLGKLLDWWNPIRILGASAFLLIVGISLSLSYRKRGPAFAKNALLRALLLLILGGFITIATLWFAPKSYVVFGILSLIGASVLLSIVAVHRPLLCLIGGILLIIEGMALSLSPMLPSMLGWIGPSPFLQTTLDYYPLIPWMGIVFIGIYLGYRVYPSVDARQQRPAPRAMRPLNWCGRHALLIYMVHQPVLFLGLRLLHLT